jgi:hypothetical protein
MLTREVVSGLNLLTLLGFAVMGIGLTLSRQKSLGAPATIGLMGAGTVLVFLGIYFVSAGAP